MGGGGVVVVDEVEDEGVVLLVVPPPDLGVQHALRNPVHLQLVFESGEYSGPDIVHLNVISAANQVEKKVCTQN